MPDPNARSESFSAPPAERLGDFRIVREIGRGGMGVVYEAEDVNLGRRVALKLLTQRMLRDANQRRRFEREAKSAAKLHHTNIVPVFGFGEADGTPYYAMQFIAGAGLDAVVAEVARLASSLSSAPPPSAPPSREHGAAAAARSLVTGGAFDGADDEPAPADEFAATGTFALAAGAEPPVPETGTHVPGGAAPRAVPTADTSAVLSGMTSSVSAPGHTASGIGRKLRKLTYWQGVARIGAQVADALDYAHRQGIVHRDVKPANLLLDAAGTVWVTDFGLAKADGGDNLTHTGDVLGTLRYMPPEAFEGKADERSDVYALGLTLYELLALRPAFDESDRNKLIKLVTQAEPARLRKVRPDVPRDLDTIVHKAIDRDPARRYQKAADLAADLQRFLDDEPIKARRQTAAEAAWRWARRHKLEAALGAVVAVALVAATVASVVLAAHFRHQEYVQRRTADERAALAEHNRKLADDNAESRRVAEAARDETNRHLYRALVQQAEALRLSRTPGYRDRVWQLLREAAQLDIPDRNLHELRQLAVSCLGDFLGHNPRTFAGFSAPVATVALNENGTEFGVQFPDQRVSCCNPLTGLKTAPQTLRTAAAARPWLQNAFPNSGASGLTAFSTNFGVLVRQGDGSERKFTTPAPPRHVSLSPDGAWLACVYLASSTGGKTVQVLQVWCVASGQALPTQQIPLDQVNRIVFSPDGQLLGCPCQEGAIIFQTSDLKQLARIRGLIVYSLAFSRDNQLVLLPSAQEDHIRVWSLETQQDLAVLPHPGGPTTACFSGDGQTVATANTTSVRLWRIGGSDVRRELKGHAGGVPMVVFSPDGSFLVSTGKDGTTRTWNPTTGAALRPLPPITGSGEAVAVSPDGRFVAVGDYNSGRVTMWQRATGREIAVWTEGLGRRISSVAFSPNGRFLAAGSSQGLRLLRVTPSGTGDGDTVTVLLSPTPNGPPASSDVGHLCFSPNGRWLVWSSSTGVVRVWDIEQGKELASPGKVFSRIRSLDFHPDGRLVFFDTQRRIVVWNIHSGAPAAVFGTPGGPWGSTPGSYTLHIGLSGDGRCLAASTVSGRGVNLWNTATGELLTTLPEESGTVWSIAWSPDGRRLAVSRSNGQVSIWDLREVHGQLARLGLNWQQADFLPGGPATAVLLPEEAAKLVAAKQWAQVEQAVVSILSQDPSPEGIALATWLVRELVAAGPRAGGTPSRAKLNEQCEQLLAKNSVNAEVAALTATVLLASRPVPTWAVLRPTEVKSANGVTMAVQPDGSVLVSGVLPDTDTYTAKAPSSVRGITAVRLEALTDPSLPGNGPGRGHGGNFHLTEFSLHAALREGEGQPVGLARAAGYRRPQEPGTTLRDGPHGSIDGTHATRWDIWPIPGRACDLILDTAAPVEGQQLIIRIDCRDANYKVATLGRFRLSVTDRPNVARDENLIALAETSNGWVQLGVARIVRGEWKDAVGALQKATADPAVAFDAHLLLALAHEHLGHPVLADLNFNAALKLTRTIDPLILEVGFEVLGRRIAREPANAELLLRRFRWHATMGHTTAAVADLTRARELDPTRKLEPNEVTALSQLSFDAAARGEWEAARTALECAPAPADAYTLSRLALVRARLGDADGHRRACEELLERFGSTQAPYTAGQLVRAWGARPLANVPARVCELAALASTPAAFAPGYQVRALGEYRAGRFAAAVEWCDKCDAAKPSADVRACSDALRAMALYRLGRTDEARAWRESAPRRVPSSARAVYAAYEWLVADLLRSEAESLLTVPVAPPPRG